jgi:phytoene dehydrogenase-like protein
MGMVIAYLRYHPARPWRKFDKIAADAWLRQWMGGKAYAAAWEFQLQGKFGDHYKEVNLAWFWARVFARTPKLAYFDGGFQAFVDHLAQRVRQQGTAITTGAAVEVIRPRAGGGFEVSRQRAGATLRPACSAPSAPGRCSGWRPTCPPITWGSLAGSRAWAQWC